jgi:hypothetical protein
MIAVISKENITGRSWIHMDSEETLAAEKKWR